MNITDFFSGIASGRMIRKTILVALLAVCVFGVHGQAPVLLDSLALDTTTAFTDLNLALKNPDKVVKLVLRKQKLKEVPKAIFGFKNLQYLDLSKNSIKELPEEIGSLHSLQYFAASKNDIEIFPPELGQLTNLRWLNLNQNEIMLLPPQIGNLSSLEYLDLWSNNLDHFPEELKNLKKLKTMDLRVILITDPEQSRIQAMLPNTHIFFSANCNCKN
jgi:Leucine-rich repeat (LRR) protein